MTERHQRTVVGLAHPVAASADCGLDGLHQVRVHLVPEIWLILAQDPIILWARMEAEAGTTLVAPFWASAWLGGQALARFVLDHPETVAGRRVLDLAAGSGLVAIAASLAGADVVLAGDAFYSRPMTQAVLPFLERASARGALVLVGDPGRADLPGGRLTVVATYPAADAGVLADAEFEQVHVLRLT
jgi:predicted nicotinamide N-methyase